MPKKLAKRYGDTNFFWRIFLALIFLSFFLFYPGGEKNSGDGITMTIDYGNGQKRNFMTTGKEKVRAWDLLQQANANYDVELEAAPGFYPRMIGNFENGENGKKWIWYKNGLIQRESPFEVEVSSGDKIVFRFE